MQISAKPGPNGLLGAVFVLETADLSDCHRELLREAVHVQQELL